MDDRTLPGSDMEVRTSLPADHGGQAWFMIACGTEISEEVNWTLLERSMDDRTHHFMPSSPSIYAWNQGEFGGPGSVAKYHVPSSFSCPDDRAVGRWIWKTSNVCNDANNVGRSTTTFVREEYAAVVGGSILTTCTQGVEHFISCVDFKVVGSSSPTPSQPSPAPTTQAPAPTPTTRAPTPAGPAPPAHEPWHRKGRDEVHRRLAGCGRREEWRRLRARRDDQVDPGRPMGRYPDQAGP